MKPKIPHIPHPVLLHISLLLTLVSCTIPEYATEDALHAYITDPSNGLSKQKEIGNITMKINYRPDDFMIWQELEGDAPDTSKTKEVFSRYEDYLYFTLQLSSGKKDALYGTSANQQDFNEKLQTLSFRMDQYVNLTTSNQDTIPVADFYYNRMFGMSNSADVLIIFNQEKVKGSEWISINTKEFGFKTGRQSFRFKTKAIDQSPKLAALKPYYETLH